jgi:RimJ/RimL family protein N-acetyltransferase
MIPQIATQRLILREFCEADLDAYADMCGNPEVMRYIGAGKPLSRSDAWRNMAMIVGHWQLRGYGMWAVEERQTGEMIGRVGCWEPEGWPGFEIGWSLRRAYWGLGFATEAATAAISYAFTQLERSHLISLINPQNIASVRVAQKVGENLQGTTEVFGTEVLVYGISREDWQKM